MKNLREYNAPFVVDRDKEVWAVVLATASRHLFRS
jgi:hypothetical protein